MGNNFLFAVEWTANKKKSYLGTLCACGEKKLHLR